MENASLIVKDLVKDFGSVRAVDGISFAVPRGSVTALLGANGAGKTTTIAMILGLLLPTSGRIEIFGEDVSHHRFRVLGRMNFSSPYVELPHRLTVLENLEIYARLYGAPNPRARIAELSEQLDFAALLKRPCGKLSAGQKTRVAMAKALVNDPDLLLLDEPTASLDPDSADRIRTLLEDWHKARGSTILLASHNMGEVERLADRVLMMKQGRIVDEGAPATLLQKHGRQTLEQVFLHLARREEEA